MKKDTRFPYFIHKHLSILKAKDKDASLFVDLMNSHYKRKKETSYFKWQYFSRIKSIYFLAKINNQVVGGCGMQVTPIQTSKKIYSAKILDLVVKKEYRGTGIAINLLEAGQQWCKVQKIQAITAFPNKYGNAFFSHFGFSSIPINAYILDNYHPAKTTISQTAFKNLEKNIYFIKDEDYLHWRFKENPEYNYQFVTDAENQGIVVTKTFKDPTDGTLYGDIVDLPLPADQTLTEQLLNKAILLFNKAGIKKVTIWLDPACVLLEFLKNNNFHPHPRERYFCIKLLDRKYPEILNFQQWFLVESDSEVY